MIDNAEEIKAARYRFDGQAYRRVEPERPAYVRQAWRACIGMAFVAALVIAGLFWRLG